MRHRSDSLNLLPLGGGHAKSRSNPLVPSLLPFAGPCRDTNHLLSSRASWGVKHGPGWGVKQSERPSDGRPKQADRTSRICRHFACRSSLGQPHLVTIGSHTWSYDPRSCSKVLSPESVGLGSGRWFAGRLTPGAGADWTSSGPRRARRSLLAPDERLQGVLAVLCDVASWLASSRTASRSTGRKRSSGSSPGGSGGAGGGGGTGWATGGGGGTGAGGGGAVA